MDYHGAIGAGVARGCAGGEAFAGGDGGAVTDKMSVFWAWHDICDMQVVPAEATVRSRLGLDYVTIKFR